MSVARSSLLMASGTVISRVLGFARAVLLAAMIGVTTNAADAFGVANQLPNNVYAIIVGGVLNAVLVPQLVRASTHSDGGRGYIDRLLTLAIVVFGSVTVLATIGAPLLVGLYTQGWGPDQLALATAFAYWCLPQLFFYGLYSMLGEVLNARSYFGPFMWAPVLNNVVALAGMGAYIVIFGMDPTGSQSVTHWSQQQISLLAGTATAGVAAQSLILFISWRKIGLHFKPNFKWRGFGLRPAAKAASWTLAMVLVTQVAGLVQTSVASTVVATRATNGDAGIAAAGIAWLVFMLPHSVVTVSVATAYFTRISQHAHRGDIAALKVDLAAGMRTIALVSLLAEATIITLAYPIARVFVGEYPATEALGTVIIAQLLGLLPFSIGFFLQKAFYALEDTRTPFVTTVIQAALFIFGALLIQSQVPYFLRVAALALLTAVTVLVQAGLAFVILRRKIGSFSAGFWFATLRFAIAAVVAGLAGSAALGAIGGVSRGTFAVATVLGAVASCALVGAVIVVVFTLMLWALRAPELKLLTAAVPAAWARLRGIVRK